MSRSEGVTILAVDQNVVEIANIADYLFVLKLGRNHAEDSIKTSGAGSTRSRGTG